MEAAHEGIQDQQTKRLHALLQILKRHRLGLTLASLREALKERGYELSERAIRRDLEALAKIGFATSKDQKSGSYQLATAVSVRRYFTLSAGDLLGLHLSQSLLKPLENTPLFDNIAAFFSKVESLMDASALAFLREIRGIYKVDAHSHWGQGVNPEILSILQHACHERLKVDIVYDTPSNKNKGKRRVGPQFIYLSRGGLYLIAEDLGTTTLKVFQLWGISEAQITKSPYYGKRVDPDEFFKNSIGLYRGQEVVRVVLWVAPDLAAFAMGRSFHPSQKNVREENGSLRIEMTTALTPELIQVVLSFGRHMTVLEPESLREKVRDEAKSITMLYR